MAFSRSLFNLRYDVKVNSTIRECNIEMGSEDWDEKKNINKRKKIILDGQDPDEVRPSFEILWN